MKNIWTVALLAIILSISFGCVGFSGGPLGSKVGFMATWGWGQMVGMALAIIVSLLAIGYMAASAMGDDKLKAWTKKEIGQAVYSVIILVAALALIGVIDHALRELSVATGSIGGSATWGTYVEAVCCNGYTLPCERKKPCHIELAMDYLQFLYESARMNAIASLMNYWFFAFLANLSVGVSLLVFVVQAGLSVTPLAGLNAAADFFSILFDLAVKTMMVTRAQQVLLEFLNYPIFSIFLAMGLILRIFYFTRKLGGLLVALALAFYTVYPMFYVVSWAVLWGFFLNPPTPFGMDYDRASFSPPFSDSNAVDFGTSDTAKELFNPQNKINLDFCSSVGSTDPAISAKATSDQLDADMIRTNFNNVWSQVEGSKWYTQFYDIIDVGLGGGLGKNGPVSALATLLVFSLVVPFLALMTTLASIKVLSPMIGGDVEISVISRLI